MRRIFKAKKKRNSKWEDNRRIEEKNTKWEDKKRLKGKNDTRWENKIKVKGGEYKMRRQETA